MNVSKKVLVIIYVIFALLTSVVIFASQGILYSSFSHLEEREAIDNAKNVKHIIDLQTTQLDNTNYVLSTREDIRAFMLSQDREHLDGILLNDLLSLSGYDLIFFANSSGNIIYYRLSGSNNTINASILSQISQKIADKSPRLITEQREHSFSVSLAQLSVACGIEMQMVGTAGATLRRNDV